MYELIQISENDYYIDCPAKIGLVKINDTDVVAIDSGNDKDAGKKVLKHVEANGWKLVAIYNTHSHADHIGGNKLIQERTGCKVYAKGLESCYTNNPILEPMTLYGGNPFKDIENKFLMAAECTSENLTEDVLPESWELINLPGHCFEMVGFRTKDNNVFLGDCVSSKETLEKYGIGYLWDPEAYINTLEMVKTLKANMFIPAHVAASNEIAELAQVNIDAVNEVCSKILEICKNKLSFEDLLQKIFEIYGLSMNAQQYVLIGSTVRSYLSYLYKQERVEFVFENSYMLWHSL